MIHRVHWSKSKLARIYPDIDPNCDKCHQEPANLSHIFWSCPTHAPFWTCVFDALSVVTSANIQPSPLLALFGVLPTGLSLPSYFTELVAFLTLLARRTYFGGGGKALALLSLSMDKGCTSFYEIGED